MTDETKAPDNVTQLPGKEETALETTEQTTESNIAIGIHVMLTVDGQFGIQLTGEADLGEVQMLLSRALAVTTARMNAETLIALQKAVADSTRIIQPGKVH